MAAIDLIGVGQSFLGDSPQVVKIKKVTLGFDEGDVLTNDANGDAAQGTYAIFDVPAGALVLDVLAVVTEAWTASLTITLGDGDDADGFLDSTEIAPQTAVSTGLFKRAVSAANAFSGGKLYAAADTIDAVVAGATPDAGKLDVYVVFIENESAL